MSVNVVRHDRCGCNKEFCKHSNEKKGPCWFFSAAAIQPTRGTFSPIGHIGGLGPSMALFRPAMFPGWRFALHWSKFDMTPVSFLLWPCSMRFLPPIIAWYPQVCFHQIFCDFQLQDFFVYILYYLSLPHVDILHYLLLIPIWSSCKIVQHLLLQYHPQGPKQTFFVCFVFYGFQCRFVSSYKMFFSNICVWNILIFEFCQGWCFMPFSWPSVLQRLDKLVVLVVWNVLGSLEVVDFFRGISTNINHLYWVIAVCINFFRDSPPGFFLCMGVQFFRTVQQGLSPIWLTATSRMGGLKVRFWLYHIHSYSTFWR